jgi:hypothetical protein
VNQNALSLLVREQEGADEAVVERYTIGKSFAARQTHDCPLAPGIARCQNS